MARRSIYLYVGNVPDAAIVKGLTDSGDDVVATHTISDTLVALQQNDEPALLVADVQAGAIALLSLLKEQRNGMPAAIMLFDREGDDIHTAIKALQLGVREYLLASDAEIHRELSARLMAERPRQRALARPAAVAIHDDGHVRRHGARLAHLVEEALGHVRLP